MLNNTRSYAQPGTLGAIDALAEILSGVKRDVARSREVLNGAFGKIAARFAQVHAIAVAAEARDSGLSDEALNALRKVTDGLTIELQFEDSLSQLLDHVQGKVEAIGVALNETRTLVSSAPAGLPEPVGPALEVLARTVKSIQMAAEAAVAERSTASGSVELF
jgi:hypothetical protein